MAMKANIGIVERIMRVIMGLLLLIFVFWRLGSAWGLLGLLPLLTGATGQCPARRFDRRDSEASDK